jgi:hypothetical protein
MLSPDGDTLRMVAHERQASLARDGRRSDVPTPAVIETRGRRRRRSWRRLTLYVRPARTEP